MTILTIIWCMFLGILGIAAVLGILYGIGQYSMMIRDTRSFFTWKSEWTNASVKEKAKLFIERFKKERKDWNEWDEIGEALGLGLGVVVVVAAGLFVLTVVGALLNLAIFGA